MLYSKNMCVILWYYCFTLNNDIMKILSCVKFVITVLFWGSLTVSGLTSCSNNEDGVMGNENPLLNTSITFKYDGNVYSYEMENGELKCDDRTKSIIDFLWDCDGLVTYIHDDGSIEYFTSEEECRNAMLFGRPELESSFNSRATEKQRYYVTLNIYNDAKYKGANQFYERIGYGSNAVNDLTTLGWGVTSFRINLINCLPPILNETGVRFYAEKNLSGQSIGYTTKREQAIDNFGNIPLRPGSTENWNDRAKSLKFGSGVY